MSSEKHEIGNLRNANKEKDKQIKALEFIAKKQQGAKEEHDFLLGATHLVNTKL